MTIFQNKLDEMDEDKDGTLIVNQDYQRINHQLIGLLIENLHEFQDLFLSKTIMAIVELQNKISFRFFKNLAIFYFLFFVTPLVLYTTFDELKDYGVYLLGSGMVVQAVLAVLEWA